MGISEKWATLCHGDWRHHCRVVAFDLDLKKRLELEWSDVRGKDSDASWSILWPMEDVS